MSILHQNATLRRSNTPAMREVDWMNGSWHNKNASRQTDAQRFLPLLERKICSGPSLRSFEYSMLIYTEASKLKKMLFGPALEIILRETETTDRLNEMQFHSLTAGGAYETVIHRAPDSFFPLVALFFLHYNMGSINACWWTFIIVYSYMETKVDNIQSVLFHQ